MMASMAATSCPAASSALSDLASLPPIVGRLPTRARYLSAKAVIRVLTLGSESTLRARFVRALLFGLEELVWEGLTGATTCVVWVTLVAWLLLVALAPLPNGSARSFSDASFASVMSKLSEYSLAPLLG